jgi:nicotinate-nucleotide adenylyltransferase
MKLGVLGGTFDPIHNGHLAVAEEVKDRLDLNEVLFVPAGQPWLKADTTVSPAEHRVTMVHLAIAGIAHYSTSTMEIEREGPSYTLDTLAEIWHRLGNGDDVYFILGWDGLSQLPRWHAPERIIRLCRLVAVPRPGAARPDLAALEGSIPKLSERVILLDKPQVDISASEIRERVARGVSITGLVPRVVEDYISEQGLYLGER